MTLYQKHPDFIRMAAFLVKTPHFWPLDLYEWLFLDQVNTLQNHALTLIGLSKLATLLKNKLNNQ